jgi:hypothetical protein
MADEGVMLTTPIIARSGYTAAMMRPLVDADLAAYAGDSKPLAVLIDLGANDMGIYFASLSEAKWKADMGYILDAMHAKFPATPLFIAKPWVHGCEVAVPSCNDVAAWIDALIAARAGWVFVGMDERTWLPAASTDWVHPTNPAGYEIMAQQWLAGMGY